MTKIRILASGIVAVALAVVLAGCDQFLPDPISYTTVAGTPIMRICIPVTVTSIVVRTADDGDDHDGQRWSATGSAFFDGGTELAVMETPDGFTSSGSIDTLAGKTIVVEMAVSSSEGGDWTTFGYIDVDSLKADVWQDGNGASIDVPCTHAPCAPNFACYNDWPIDPAATSPAPTFTGLPTPQPTSSSAP